MKRKRFTTEQIIHKLRLAEVEIAKRKSVQKAVKAIRFVPLQAATINPTYKIRRLLDV